MAGRAGRVTPTVEVGRHSANGLFGGNDPRGAHHQVVPMDHLRAAADAQDGLASGEERPLILSASSAS